MHRQSPSITLLTAAAAALLLGCSGQERGSVAAAQAAPHAVTQPASQPQPAVAAAAVAQPAALTAAEQIARGKQLVALAGCGHCHTPMAFDPKLGMPVPRADFLLGGHPVGAPDPQSAPGAQDQAVIGATFTAFRLPFGTVYAANLTPDAETGLGAWSADDFIKTMRTGHHRGTGRAVLPPMPWQNLAAQPDAELHAIFAYLQSIPKIRNPVPAARVPAEVIAGISKSNTATAHLPH